MSFVRRLLPLPLGLLLLSGCAVSETTAGAGDGPLTVYATTGYLADAVATIAPDAEVTTMVGPGGDPHTYQPSTRDIETMRSADLVLWNGLHLEAQMIDQLESLGERQLAVGDLLPEELLLPLPETDHAGRPLHDPHIWNSPAAWGKVIDHIAERLAELSPDHAADYLANAAGYRAEFSELDAWTTALLAEIPEPRILVTGHDAFGYFGRTYDLEVRATDFISTEAALSATELSELADYIVEHEVPVIFQDNQANPQAVTSLREAVEARGWTVTVSTEELFADSLGPTAPVDTHLGVFEHNATVVAEALVR
ncbi:zinc ABC transporter substrate-binding protein [Corynebacterium sp. YIM 101645]|uniref:Zinc ABC transporter substrate-binding protein n=1 Tax=Corynebacterium lemuris TaxID=1859292 RepID=A0ABT2FTN1_9CORY|nr:zinc ABC transporter substrate-binding protein [Corynebacterium lemuris]MCS5478566.1 zinc ABC transporter substrate-binding protein [Corynebacterium lemuris]